MELNYKHPTETITVDADFTPILRAGETLDGTITVTVTDTSDNSDVTGTILVAGSAAQSSGIISARMQAGTASKLYKITVNTGVTSASNTYEQDIFLSVDDNDQLFSTVARIKTSLGLTTSTDDAVILELIKSTTSFVEQETKRVFFKKTYTEEFLPDETTRDILLKNFPVISVASIAIDGVTVDATTNSLDSYKVGTEGCVTRLDGGVFPKAPSKTIVTYEAGYDSIPAEVSQIVNKIVIGEYNHRLKEGILSEGIGDYKVSFGTLSATGNPDIKNVLQRYTRRQF